MQVSSASTGASHVCRESLYWVSLRCTGCTYTCVCPQSPRTGWAGLAFPIRAAPTGALASVMEGTFLSSGILLWNSGPCQPVPCLLTINYLIYIH